MVLCHPKSSVVTLSLACPELAEGRVSLACPELAEGKGELTLPTFIHKQNSFFERTTGWHFKSA